MHFPSVLLAGLAGFVLCLVLAGRFARRGLQALDAAQKVALVDQVAKRRSTGLWVSLALVVGYFAALTQFENRRYALLGYFVVAGVLVALGVYRSGGALREAGILAERAKPFRVASWLRVAGLLILFAGVWLSLGGSR